MQDELGTTNVLEFGHEMKIGRLISSLICLTALQPGLSLASSADISTNDISAAIKIEMDRSQSQSEACKLERRSAVNQCGRTYIFPRLTLHPDSKIAGKINTFIASLESTSANETARIESWSEVTLNKHNILSLSYSGQIYQKTGYAGQTIKTCSNLNAANGEEISLEEILKPGYENALPRLISNNLESALRSKLPGYVRGLLAKKGSDWTVRSNQSFLLDQNHLSLCYDDGGLGSEVIGPISISLPYTLLSGLIHEQGPLAFAINTKISAQTQLPKQVEKSPSISLPKIAETNIEDAGGIGSVDYTCNRGDVTHSISVVEYAENSPFICTVEYDKVMEQKTLWRSRQTKPFCHDNAKKLVAKYEDKWGYTCLRTQSLPNN